MSVIPSHDRNDTILFVGTYTEPEGSQSEGIYVYRMDRSSGQLTFDSVIKGIINPSFLEIHPQQNFLYAVSEVDRFDGQPGGGVSAININSASGESVLLNAQSSHGEHPCYVSIERTSRFALVANYSSGSIAMLPIRRDGRLAAATDVIQHSGSSVHPDRQAGPHAHCILLLLPRKTEALPPLEGCDNGWCRLAGIRQFTSDACRLRPRTSATPASAAKETTPGSGTAAPRRAQSAGVTSGPAALRPKLAARRLKSDRFTVPL